MAPVFLHSKSNTLDLQSFCSNKHLSTVLWCFLLSFITYKAFVLKSLANLQISVDKLVGKLLINLLNHTKSVICVISIIIKWPSVTQALIVIRFSKLHNINQHLHIAGAVIIWCLQEVFQENED